MVIVIEATAIQVFPITFYYYYYKVLRYSITALTSPSVRWE